MSDQPGLFDHVPLAHRPLAREQDVETSQAAAAVVEPELGKLQRLVLEVYRRRGPMTARDAERLPDFEAYGFSTIRKRISELAHDGWLEAAGIDQSRRAPATIYRAVPR